MTKKSSHGITLWAVPRFHRPDFLPATPVPASAPLTSSSREPFTAQTTPAATTGEPAKADRTEAQECSVYH